MILMLGILLQLLGDILLDNSNAAVMVRYVSSLNNMRILMNNLSVNSLASKHVLITSMYDVRAQFLMIYSLPFLSHPIFFILLQDPNKSIQRDAFDVFKVLLKIGE